MERSQNMGTLIGFDAHASRARGLRRIDSRGSTPAACYAFAVYASQRNADAARVLTTAEVAQQRGVLDATNSADVRRLVQAAFDVYDGPEVA